MTEERVFALLNVVGARARAGHLVGKRDYALLLLYITTGMRRNEVISLRIYVESIAVKTDKYSQYILEALELPDFESDFS